MRPGSGIVRNLSAWGLVCLVSCARPQLILFVDTDAPILSQIEADGPLSPDGAIDMLRVDVLGADGTESDRCELLRPQREDWPVSLGLAVPMAEAGAGALRIRLRAFRRALARIDREANPPRLCGVPQADGSGSVTNPPPEATIDRLLAVPLRADDRVRAGVLLSFECMGTPVDFRAGTTCLDRARLSVTVAEGVGLVDAASWAPPSRLAGTAAGAREIPCPAGIDLPADRVCIPGVQPAG